jgi:hypothetical protein
VIGYPLELTGFQGKEVVFSFCNLMHITLSALDVSFLSMFVDIIGCFPYLAFLDFPSLVANFSCDDAPKCHVQRLGNEFGEFC